MCGGYLVSVSYVCGLPGEHEVWGIPGQRQLCVGYLVTVSYVCGLPGDHYVWGYLVSIMCGATW